MKRERYYYCSGTTAQRIFDSNREGACAIDMLGATGIIETHDTNFRTRKCGELKLFFRQIRRRVVNQKQNVRGGKISKHARVPRSPPSKVTTIRHSRPMTRRAVGESNGSGDVGAGAGAAPGEGGGEVPPSESALGSEDACYFTLLAPMSVSAKLWSALSSPASVVIAGEEDWQTLRIKQGACVTPLLVSAYCLSYLFCRKSAGRVSIECHALLYLFFSPRRKL